MLRQREKTEGKADYLRWIRVEVDDPGRKRGVKRKERKESGREELTGVGNGKAVFREVHGRG